MNRKKMISQTSPHLKYFCVTCNTLFKQFSSGNKIIVLFNCIFISITLTSITTWAVGKTVKYALLGITQKHLSDLHQI